MKKIITIKRSRDFSRAFKRGKSVADKYLVIYIYKNNIEINRIGISIGKKVGNSVNRNRVKRLIRENYRQIKASLEVGFDVIFIPRQLSKDAKCKDIYNSIFKLFKKLGILSKEVIK